MRVAIIHDWLTVYAGAERVLEQMLKEFPEADIFTLIDTLSSQKVDWLSCHSIHTSFISKLPLAKTRYRSYLPIMPFAIEQFDLTGYDLIISSSHAVAKGVITGPDQLHICMCYTPIRYAWELKFQYLKESNLFNGLNAFLAKYILHRIKIWDFHSSVSVDSYISISKYISRRIYKCYRRSSTVIYPPVDTEAFISEASGPRVNDTQISNYYVVCSRLVPYKKIDLISETFTKLFPNEKLIIIGDGPDFKKISKSRGPNVEMLGFVDEVVKRETIAAAKAFIFAADEDFGIAPVEAQASGVPVIAYGKGGSLETVIADGPRKTGVFFYQQTIDSIAAAIREFQTIEHEFTFESCIMNAERFSIKRFREEFRDFISDSVDKHEEQRI